MNTLFCLFYLDVSQCLWLFLLSDSELHWSVVLCKTRWNYKLKSSTLPLAFIPSNHRRGGEQREKSESKGEEAREEEREEARRRQAQGGGGGGER